MSKSPASDILWYQDQAIPKFKKQLEKSKS